MLLIIGLVMVVFGEGWRVLGVPARNLGTVLLALGIAEGFLYSWLARQRTRQARRALFSAYPESPEDLQAPEVVRHVPLLAGGRGATFMLIRREDNTHTWSYDLDWTPDPEEDLMVTLQVNQAITDLEKELRLPLTFPYMERKKEEPPQTAEEIAAEDDRRRKMLQGDADEGDKRAIIAMWELDGKPIKNPDELEEGVVYDLGFDLGIYRGKFTGRRWEGFPDLDNEPEVREWFTFEGADSGREDEGRAGIRLSAADFAPETLKSGRITHNVVRPPVENDEALELFKWKRAEYRKWEAGRDKYLRDERQRRGLS